MLKVRNDAFKNYNSMCSKFGITPSDRARLSAPVKNEQNPFSDFD
jgi:phage terminase small subunit